MKLSQNSEALAEGKILILYLLEKANAPVLSDTLFNIVLATNNMNYFYFRQFILDLIDANYIAKINKEKEELYLITEEGKKTLNLTLDILPGIVKLNADENLKPILSKKEEENSVVAEFIPISQNEFNVICKIIESNEVIFEIKIFAGSREKAQEIIDNWENNAKDLYPKLLNIMTTKKNNTDLKSKK